MIFLESDWVLTDAEKIPGRNHLFWKISKIRVIYVGENKPLPYPNVWIWQVVWVLHRKAWGATNGA